MEQYDVIVIGAGPAGLFGAIGSQDESRSRKVLLLEKNPKPGKKLRISGAGQCNFTHSGDIKDFLSHYGENGKFLKRALYYFSNQDLLRFFEARGLDFVETPEGKIFPITMKAEDVLDVLLKECDKKGINILCNHRVESIAKDADIFRVYTGDREYSGKYVIIATGGMSYPSTGSTGDGYEWARSLGHSISKPIPALTPLYIKDHPFSELSGISFQGINISLWREGKKIKGWRGDVLITHRGLSGPGILNYSRYVLPGDIIRLNFVSIENEEEFHREFINLLQKHGKSLVKNALKNIPIPERLIQKLMALSGISEKDQCAYLDKERRKRIAGLLYGFPFEVEKLGDFNIAMVTRGGVSLKEVNPNTMESRIVPGLFFAGEILDVDGDTGGYNIQAAFSTGWLAGTSISHKQTNNGNII